MTEMNGEGYGDCCQAEFPSDWPHTFTKELFAMKLKGLLILHVKDSWESFQISEKLFPKCILIRLADWGCQRYITGVAAKPQRSLHLRGGDWVTVVMTIAQHRELLPPQSSGVSL